MCTCTSILEWIATIGYIVSLIFVLVTFVVYTILPELRNIHGLSLRGFLGCHLLSHIFFMVDTYTRSERINTPCILWGFTNFFLFIASFFWLNVCCFDVWLTLGNLYPSNGNDDQRERKKFIIYSVYAWGSGILLTAIFAIVIIFVLGIPDPTPVEIEGSTMCFLTDEPRLRVFVYFLIPASITIVLNVILFILTVTKIICHKIKAARHLQGTESKRHDNNKPSFILYVKLFIVMGMDWPIIAIAIAAKSSLCILYISLVLNSLQGTIIFIIFVCKKRILRLLIERCCCRKLNRFIGNSIRNEYQSSTVRTAMTGIPAHEGGDIMLCQPER